MKNNGVKPAGALEHFIAQKRDAYLIKQILSGDKSAFEKLFKHYRKRLYSLGMSFFKNEVDTDDFIQEVFVKIYTSIHTFKGEAAFSTWLTRIAYNTAINVIKRRKETEPLLDDTELFDPDLTPEEKQIRSITIQTVRDAVKALPEKYALCLELYFFYDMSYDHIADVTEIPLNTLKSHIFRAKNILREKLRDFYHD